jgi:hypothetical protein
MCLLRVLTTEQRCSNTLNHGGSDLPHRRNSYTDLPYVVPLTLAGVAETGNVARASCSIRMTHT